MNRLLVLSIFLVAALVAAQPLLANDRDVRLVTREFNPDEVVRIEGRPNIQASIEFAPEEHIENVAVGDSNSWQITPNRRANLLFVKPLSASARTNMTVVTDRRTYFFDLVASASARPLYLLRFTYPDEPVQLAAAETPAEVPAALTETGTASAGGEATPPPPAPIDLATLNFAWERRGKEQLLPAQVYDDGQSTYLKWETNVPLPAILIRNERGEEGPVNFAVREDTIVVDGVPALIILRSGRDRATLENEGPPTRLAARPTALATVPPATEALAQPGN